MTPHGPLSALAFVRPDLGRQLMTELHVGAGRPVRVLTCLPLFEKASAARTMQQMTPQVVLVQAEVDGYSLPEAQSLRRASKDPVLIAGLAQAGGAPLEAMLGAQLEAVYPLPLSAGTIERMCAELPQKYEGVSAAWGKGAWGAAAPETLRAAAAAAGGAAWQRQVIALWAPKGGVGKTALACELAVILASIGGRDVALVDANMNGGHVRLRLNVEAQNGILNAASAYHTSRGHASLEADLPRRLEALLAPLKGAENLKVLPGVRNMEQPRHEHLAGANGLEFARALIPSLARKSDFVIIDVGSSVNVGVHQGALQAVDTVLVICEPDLTSIADAREGVHRSVIPRLGFGSERFKLVINKWQDELGVSLLEAARYANLSAVGIIPLDATGNLTLAGNEGRSYVATYANRADNPRGTEAALQGLAELAAQFYPPIAAAWSERLKVAGQKRRFRLFGRG